MTSPGDAASGSVRARHRRALLDAAREIISTDGVDGFSVDLLATRAHVSRRTVFNHFATIDDIIASSCTEAWAAVISEFRVALASHPLPHGSGRLALFEAVAQALRASDAPGIISYLWRALGGFDQTDQRPAQIFHTTFARTTVDLSLELSDQSGTVDRLDADLIVSSLMSGVEVIAHHWITQTGAHTDAASRRAWNALLERLIRTLRDGYNAPASTKENG